jgi:hypothetical protein
MLTMKVALGVQCCVRDKTQVAGSEAIDTAKVKDGALAGKRTCLIRDLS